MEKQLFVGHPSIYDRKQSADYSPDFEGLIRVTTKEMLKYVSLLTGKNY